MSSTRSSFADVGRTFLSWANLKVNKADSTRAKQKAFAAPDARAMYEKCRTLSWILIDEGSTAAAEVVAGLHAAVTAGVRERNTYKVTQDGESRLLAGMNLLFFVDWWQLPPVLATSLSQNPFAKTHSSSVQQMLNIFWSKDTPHMNLNKTFEMLVPNRSGDDPFFQAFLTECRHGNQQWEMYWFVHGMPTNTTGSWLPTTKAPECGSERCTQLCEGVWPQQLREGTS